MYGPDACTLVRVTITYGLRWEYLSEQVSGQPAQSGRFARIPAFDDIHMPIWRTFSPRTAVVYDLFGNGKTAVRFGFNRFEAAATTTNASIYNPANVLTVRATAAWTDLNKDDIAQGELGCVYQTPGCEVNLSQLRQGFGTRAQTFPNQDIKRVYNIETTVGVQHELLPGVQVNAGWFHRAFHNLPRQTN